MASIPEIFSTLAYGPAPEAVAPAHRVAGASTAGDSGSSSAARGPSRVRRPSRPEPGHRQAARPADPGGRRRRGSRGACGPRRAARMVGASAGTARARHLYAVARQIQKQSRFFAVLESLDNGKPIRESRDIDVPLVARHFYHHAGWAQLMERELPGRVPRRRDRRRSFPGTSRCSCWRGRSRPRWRWGTRWCSSPPSSPR